eukprot:CAMPEP_0185740004 /NCGR_PEP_ID=MMETSP1171-20130828/36750_1 /TAXON_ID=374046 /ORGANISM="Helicotheca tamensis, Strain CCMP826" /LENGTH=78 /DNA_ID=CAMNT_0028411731 /DNA_START=68 /DNA_END=301 /DNA_ORIENTATION=+
MAMKMKDSIRNLSSNTLSINDDGEYTADNEHDIMEINRMLETYELSVIREKIFNMQQEMYAYHGALDKIERLKSDNEK